MAEQDYASPQERLSGQDWSGVAKSGISSMAPAEKGWILAVAVMFLGMMGINYFNVRAQAVSLDTYLKNDHSLRETLEQHRSEELRRCQESIKLLADTLARQSDHIGRKVTGPSLTPELKLERSGDKSE